MITNPKIMSEENHKSTERTKDEKSTNKNRKLNRELEQTFPASDPPSRTRPGHEAENEE